MPPAPLTPKDVKRPREITAIAVAAFVGSVLNILAGILFGVSAAAPFLAVKQRYPGLPLNQPSPEMLLLEEVAVLVMVIPIVLGVIGIITGVGLLRLRRWARISAMVWCFASSLGCLVGLGYAASPGSRVMTTAFLAPMLILYPINAWWLIVLLRPANIALFSKRESAQGGISPPEWLKENFVAKTIIGIAAVALLGAVMGWMMYRNSPKRELERTRDALAAVKSWHYHTVRYIPGLPPETREAEIACPAYWHSIVSSGEPGEVPQVRESYGYFGNVYTRVGDHWVTGKSTADTPECHLGPLADENSLPLPGVIEEGAVKKGELKDVDGESCREFSVSVPTPHDPKEKEFQFTICINEQDHLPRETRRTAPDRTQEGVSRYNKWNGVSEELPPEIPR